MNPKPREHKGWINSVLIEISSLNHFQGPKKLWKLEGNKLQNKKHPLWNNRPESNGNWILGNKDGLVFIENTSNQQRLGKLERGESAFKYYTNAIINQYDYAGFQIF